MDSQLCIKSERTECLSFVDFLEVLARISLNVTVPPPSAERPLHVAVVDMLYLYFPTWTTDKGKQSTMRRRARQYLVEHSIADIVHHVSSTKM